MRRAEHPILLDPPVLFAALWALVAQAVWESLPRLKPPIMYLM